jgi:thiol-disulfide isomerase/thioredoxin
MRLRLFLSFFLAFNVLFSQEKAVTPTLDKAGNIIGYYQKEDLLQQPFKDWYDFSYDYYTADEAVVKELKSLLKKVEIKVFMGSWCHDSQELVPAFYNVLDACDYKYKKLQNIGLNRGKSTPDHLEEGYDIIRVPTFIFYRKGEEIGRIVEYPQETLEADMLKILKGEDYQHSYVDYEK